MRVVLIGAGRVGTAVALLLKRSGAVIVGVSSRSRESSDRAARLLDCEKFDFHVELPESDVVLIGAGDEAIEQVATVVSTRLKPETFVCHFAGSLGMAPLKSASDAGGHSCALHPVQACPDVDTAIRRLPGSAWGVTCESEAFDWAGRFVASIDGRPVRVAEEDRPVWHAAAVSVSNGIAALLAVGESMLESIAIKDPESVLGPLASGTVQNARDGGGGAATLTGPVVRNERFAIRHHLDVLLQKDVDLANEYAQVAAIIVRAAERSGRLQEEDARELLDELGAQ